MAIPAGHLSLAACLSYLTVVARVAEEHKATHPGPILATLYDDLFRKQVAKRAQIRAPLLDLKRVFTSIDSSVLEAAKVRLAITLQASGVRSEHAAPPTQPASDSLSKSLFAAHDAA